MKKFLILGVVVLVLTHVPHVFAQTAPSGYVPLAPITGLTDTANTSVINSNSLATFFNNLYKYLIGLAAVIAIVEIIWGGLEISTKDSVSSHSDGKQRITEAILGLILVLSPALVFSIINPSILNLSLNLPPIKPTATTPTVTAVLGSTQTCAAGSNLATCVTQNQSACTTAGGTPQTREGGSVGSETITCIPNNQSVVTPGSSITAQQCAALSGHSTGGAQALQPIVVSASDAKDCNVSNIDLLKAGYTANYCANITGGGVCLYNQ